MTWTLANCVVHTGAELIADGVVVIDGDVIAAVGPRSLVPAEGEFVDAEGCFVTAGFVDVQVNGGGDVLFNDAPTVETIERIVEAHARFGTTSLLPTYMTGPIEGMVAAREAAVAAHRAWPWAVPGIHFEGPMISPKRLGVHDGTWVRHDVPGDLLAAHGLTVLVTLAPEVVASGTVRDLVGAGAVVALGHSDAEQREVAAAIAEGATGATHLYNAMSPLAGRHPGMVGTVLAHDGVWASVIVDGHHVHPDAVRLAWLAKRPGHLVLVTDAMPPVGGTSHTYSLGPHHVSVVDGRCTTGDGVLAGSALDMATAVRNCVVQVGLPIDEAFRMASLYPAEAIGIADRVGRVAPGYVANLVLCDADVRVQGVVRAGRLVRQP